jgi:ribosomal protein S6--L-glutamate ligase
VVGVKGQWSSEGLADAMAARTGFRLLVDLEDAVFDSSRGGVYVGDLDLCDLDGLAVKKIGTVYSPSMLDRIELLRYIAASGVPVLSRPASIQQVVNRLSGTITLRQAGIPLPPTVVTEDTMEAVRAVERFERAILKPLFTTKARGMRVLTRGADLAGEIRRFREEAGPVLYVQKMVDVPGRDLGVAFLGGRYIGTYARVSAPGAWNTTTREGGFYAPHDPSPEALAVAERAQELFDLDFTTVDVVETSEGPRVFEVSAFGGFRGLQQGLRIDAASLVADYVVEKVRERRSPRVVDSSHG